MKFSLKRFWPKNKFAWAVVFESLVVLLFGAYLISRPVTNYEWSAEELAKQNEVKLVNGAVELTKENNGLKNLYGHFHIGGYEVSADYEIVSDDEDKDNTADLIFMNSRLKNEVPDSRVVLTDLSNNETGRVYSNISQAFVLRTLYNGEKKFRLYGIHIKEFVPYRFALIAIILMVFAFIDAIYLFYTSKKIAPQTKKIVTALVGIVFLASLAFFGDVISSGHDTDFHLSRISAVAEELKNGSFPSRMMTSMLNDHAYPNSIFYCDIFLYIPALLYLAFIPLRTCYQIYYILITIATCLIAYFSMKKITNHTKASLVGSLIYTVSAYRLSNVLVRGAVGEFTAMTFIPLIILGLYQIFTTEKPRLKEYAPLGVGIALISMCHVISTEICVAFVLLFCLINIKKTLKKSRFFSLVKAALLCLALAVWSLVPLVDYMLHQSTNIANRGLVGFKQEMAVNLTMYLDPVPNSPQFITFGIALVAAVALSIWFLIKNKDNEKVEKSAYKTVKFLTIFGSIALFAGSSFFPWNTLFMFIPKQLTTAVFAIQFPFRFISIATAVFAFAAAIVLANLKNTTLSEYRKQISFALIIAAILSTFSLSYSCMNEQKILSVPYATKESAMKIANAEYLPAAKKKVADSRKSKVVVNKNEKQVKIDFERVGSEYHLTYNNASDEEVTASLPVYAYRYFEATDGNGRNVELGMSDDYLISVKLAPKTEGTITVKFVSPTFWRVAEIVSLVTLLCLCFYAIIKS